MQLTQKERMLLEDQKQHEEMCVKKYNDASKQADDPELKQLFANYAGQEQQHLNTVNQILNGQMPSTQQGQQQGQQKQQQGQQQQASAGSQNSASQKDADLCNDMLMVEKYVSGAYNTTIFECTDSQVRQTLNHIQKEEQQHGEGIFNYMQKKGAYQPS